jgi:hypothetical protein
MKELDNGVKLDRKGILVIVLTIYGDEAVSKQLPTVVQGQPIVLHKPEAVSGFTIYVSVLGILAFLIVCFEMREMLTDLS